MQRVALLSDTHVPSRADRIPAWVLDRIEAADAVIHAGDFDSREALSTVQSVAPDRFVAVAGNMDPGRLDLPRVGTLDVADVRFVVTHGTGPPGTYSERVYNTAAERAGPGETVGIAGHTHDVLDTSVKGIRLCNPGSATGAPPAREATMMECDVTGSEIEVRVLSAESD